jgi:glycosyltransferase involved in cell wall biosynthesis
VVFVREYASPALGRTSQLACIPLQLSSGPGGGKQQYRPKNDLTPMSPPRPLTIATNIAGLDKSTPGMRAILASCNGSWGDTWRLFRQARRCDAVVINIAVGTVTKLCLLRMLWPFARWRLISVDILLPRPTSASQRIATLFKRFLLRRVDLFILYFHELSGYSRYYGITRERVAYVPFKSNSWERLPPRAELSNDGAYVITAGRTMRDLATFVAAMRELPYPAVLLHLRDEQLGQHGTALPRQAIPPNVRLVEHDGNRATWIEHIRGAKVVALPILPATISSSGIGTYIDSMAMHKCVVLTRGIATIDVISDQAVLVPAQDPAALACAVRQAWEDPALRAQFAARGRDYAEQLQGEERLHLDIAAATLRFLNGRDAA